MSDRLENGERRAQLEYFARCDQAFTPFAPIDLMEFFVGRSEVIHRLSAEIDAPGRHAAIFGERGVGKTSLAKLAYFFLRRDEENTHFVSCHHASTFDTIFTDVLAGAGIDAVLDEVESEGQQQGTLGGASIGWSSSRRLRKTFRRVNAGQLITQRFLLKALGDLGGLIIIDEYDRVLDASTHTRMAELVKAFSDAASKTKLIIVGVADSLVQLIGEHQSLSRSLAQIRLERMSDVELSEIIERGSRELGTQFPPALATRIVRIADGFPSFVHLLCRHACRRAPTTWFRNPSTVRVISETQYQAGLRDAIENAEHTLEGSYEKAIVTTRRRSELFAMILGAIAASIDRDVQVKEIAENIAQFEGAPARKPSSFNFHLGELTKEKRDVILTKVRDGYYKFTNPLMRPYIRFKLELENWTRANGQLEFPFMREPAAR